MPRRADMVRLPIRKHQFGSFDVDHPLVSIVIVNWNGRDVLQDCLRSIAEHRPTHPFVVLVVDNASTDGSVEWLKGEARRLFPGHQLRILVNQENIGFGAANNLAFGAIQSEFVFLLNSDAKVTHGTIDRLIDCLRSHEDVGACGPRIVGCDGRLHASVWRNPPAAWQILLEELRLSYLLPRAVRGRLLLGQYWNHDERRRNRSQPGGHFPVN
jgi:N-acetylglucosaminyl-diphospho-decaprenol L-rhamnosyltransferase